MGECDGRGSGLDGRMDFRAPAGVDVGDIWNLEALWVCEAC